MRTLMLYVIVILFGFTISCGKDGSTGEEANTGSAKIVFSVGDVKVEKGKDISDAKVDMALDRGNIIVTGVKAQCNIQIGNDSYISVKEKTRLVIDQLTKSTEGMESSTVDLKVGRLVVNPKKLLKDENFKVRTPTAVAAVRGTKFVVSQDEGVETRVSVVEGMVEMKPRVEAIEEAQNDATKPDATKSDETKSAIATEIQKKIDEKAIVIEANQSATIDAKAAVEFNNHIETAISDFKQTIPETQAKTEKGGDAVDVKPSIPIVEVEKAVKNIATVEIKKEKKIDRQSVEEIKEFDQKIEEVKQQTVTPDKKTASLTISTPEKRSLISINGKKVGYGAISLKVDAEVPLKIEITAKDFDKYETEFSLGRNEEKTLAAPLVRSKLRDRVDWSNSLGSGVKGDVLFHGNLVIVTTSSGAVVAMTKDGGTMWRAQLPGGLDSTPAVSDNSLFVVTRNGALYAVNITNGRTLWSAKINGTLVFGAAPKVVDKSVFVATSTGKIYSYSLSGKEQWMTDIKSGIYSTPSFGDGRILVGSEDQFLYALSSADGEISWKAELDARIVSSSPLISGDMIYVGTYKGTLYALRKKNGKSVWTVKTGGAIVSSPVMRKDKVYIGSRDGVLYSIQASSGAVAWKFAAGKPVIAEVSYNDKELYVGSGKMIYALNPESGKQIWSYVLENNVTSVVADNDLIFVGTGANVFALRMDLRDIVR
jgi:outer membrane protein assembly factor BamB